MIPPEDAEKVIFVTCGLIHDAIVPWAVSRQDFSLQPALPFVISRLGLL